MDIVTVKNKFQIVIPQHVREQVRVEIGDILEAGVENGKITFTPKSLVDRHLAEGLEDARKGRTHGPYATGQGARKAIALPARQSRPSLPACEKIWRNAGCVAGQGDAGLALLFQNRGR